MYTLDANVFVRDADARDPDHRSCRALLKQLAITNTPVTMPLLVLAEVAGALSREFRDPLRARIFIDLLTTLPNVTFVALDTELAQEAAYLAADRALRGADAMYVAVARRYRCALVSLDREQRERAALLVPTLTPTEALAKLNATP
ncbi:type II toxin-antitoxin system VapC family toxin [Candidatus Viridilinea mediisalina]|uniref:Ribonuclease VapC n=1 Tax=Candidatus Viridilinea mediisalina TaxID=2024553 RepID=A0A2A6RLK5_9CHLR|nr:type II toxin-antitoxin system VapC family toxin [Candidatus Viridilinea mediisalina]PDW03738.1 VapC toxin family PIN domain ribonuclease [Candidatus Viridilinea mediisalina]